MNSAERLSFLIRNYSEGKCSKEEFEELLSLVEIDYNKDQIFLGLKEVWNHTVPAGFPDEERWAQLYHSHMDAAEKKEFVKPAKNSNLGYPFFQAIWKV